MFVIRGLCLKCTFFYTQDGRIKVGDRILAVDDEPVVGAAIDKVCFHVSEVVQ